MATFKFNALSDSGKEISSTIEAPDRQSAISIIRSRDLRPIQLEEIESEEKAKANLKIRKSVKSDDIVMFTRQLSAMVSAGVPIMRALNSMADHTENAFFKSTLLDVAREVEGGKSLADSLEKHPSVFNDVYVNMVRAGEAAGILDDILKRLALQQEKNASIRKKVKGAMTYPMVLIFITIVAFFGLMLFVIPSIGNTIKDLAGEEAELPVITQIMLSISDFFVSKWYIVFPIIGGIIWLVLRYIKTPSGKKKFHQFILKAPVVSQITKKLAIARFTRTFSALIGAGVTIIESLHITARAVGNIVYEESLEDAANRIKNGEQLSQIINEDENLYPPIVGQMLMVGEETGETDQVLVKVADFYEDEVDTAISSLSSTIEPIMIVLMGSMVGLIAASVISPITGLSNQITA